jgi:hypothetical protein
VSAPLVLGREATHGTVAASFSSAPVNFNSKLRKSNVIPEEQRGGQDVHYANIPGSSYQEWNISDSYIYEDNFGFFLDSAIGLPASVVVGGETLVWDSTFKFLDDPSSLSFKWVQPRRTVQAYQSLWAVVDKLTITFEAGGLLKWTASGIGMSETEVTTPAFSFSTRRPMTAWEGVVTLLGSTFARLVKGSITISRNRKPFFTINNTADPTDVSIGNRIVEFALTCDFNSKTVYDDFKGATPTDALTVVWTDNGTTIGSAAHPQFTAKMGTIGWEAGEINTGEDFPQVELTGKGIYNSSDASTFVAILRSTKQYSTVVS